MKPRRASVIAAIVAGGLALPGCATSVSQTAGENVSTAARTASTVTSEGISDAASAPLEDLNLIRDSIPEPLAAIDYVYRSEPMLTCAGIAAELAEIAPFLGRDYDDPKEDRSLGERGGEAAGDFVIDTVRGLTTGWIPYRSIVRQATGASAADRAVARAFTDGHARRAFLQGYGAAIGCAPPASPLSPVPIETEDDEDKG